MKTVEPERYQKTKGPAAEEIHFGDISTGAHNDLSKATDIARSMVKEYGMSKKLGQIYFERERTQSFLDMTAPPGKDYSESTAQTIDDEVKKIIDSQYEVAANILNEHKEVLDEGAELLSKEENIEGDRLKGMLEAHKNVA